MAAEEALEGGIEMLSGLFSGGQEASAIARAIEEAIEMGQVEMDAARVAEQSAGYQRVISHMEGMAQGFAQPMGSDRAFAGMHTSSNKMEDLKSLDERTQTDIYFNKKMVKAWVNFPPRFYSASSVIGVWDKAQTIFDHDKIGGIGTTYWPREHFLNLTLEDKYYIEGKDKFWKPVAYYPYKSYEGATELENNTDELTWLRFNFDKWQWKGQYVFGFLDWEYLPEWIKADDVNIFESQPNFENNWNDQSKVGKNPITDGSWDTKGSITGEYKEYHTRWRARLEPYSLYGVSLKDQKDRLEASQYYDDLKDFWLTYGKVLYDFLENPDIAAGYLYYAQTELKTLAEEKNYEKIITDKSLTDAEKAKQIGRTAEYDRLEAVFSRLETQFSEMYNYFNDIYENRPEEKLIRNSSVVESMGEAAEGENQSSALAESLDKKNEADLYPYPPSLLKEAHQDEEDLNRRLVEVQERMVNQKKEEARIIAQKEAAIQAEKDRIAEEERVEAEEKRKADELQAYIESEHQKNLEMYARAAATKRPTTKPKGRYQLYDERRRQQKKDLQETANFQYEVGQELWLDGEDKFVVRSRLAELTLNEVGVLTGDNPKISYHIRSDITGNTDVIDNLSHQDYNARLLLKENPKPPIVEIVETIDEDEEREKFLYLQKQYLYLLKLKSLL